MDVDNILSKATGDLYGFSKGDLIKRSCPKIKTKTIYNENLGITVEVEDGVENSFVEEPIEFIGISQGVMYYKYTGSMKRVLSDTYRLIVENYNDGNWEIFEKPNFL